MAPRPRLLPASPPLQGRFWVFAAFEKFYTLARTTKRCGGSASRYGRHKDGGGGDKRPRTPPGTLSFTAASVSATCKRVNGEPFVIQNKN